MSQLNNLIERDIRRVLGQYALEFMWDEAWAWYGSLPLNTALHYHNADHARKVAYNVADMLRDTPLATGTQAAVLLAAAWHDAIYIPGAPGGVSERASAAAMVRVFLADARSTSLGLDTVTEADRLIEGTTVEVHLATESDAPRDLDQQVLNDADLASLATTYSEFVATQLNIFNEGRTRATTDSDIHKSASFLKQFLTHRPYIFHTEYGRAHFEARARNNIKRWYYEHIDFDPDEDNDPFEVEEAPFKGRAIVPKSKGRKVQVVTEEVFWYVVLQNILEKAGLTLYNYGSDSLSATIKCTIEGKEANWNRFYDNVANNLHELVIQILDKRIGKVGCKKYKVVFNTKGGPYVSQAVLLKIKELGLL